MSIAPLCFLGKMATWSIYLFYLLHVQKFKAALKCIELQHTKGQQYKNEADISGILCCLTASSAVRFCAAANKKWSSSTHWGGTGGHHTEGRNGQVGNPSQHCRGQKPFWGKFDCRTFWFFCPEFCLNQTYWFSSQRATSDPFPIPVQAHVRSTD